MIQEDYVSFEVSKLLKEKGFVGEREIGCRCGFYEQNKEYPNQINLVYDDLNNSELEWNECLRFTHQMVLAWLREEKNIIITIQTRYPNNPEITTHPYSFLIEDYSETRDKNRGGKYMTGYSSTAGMDEFLIENDYLKEGLNFGEFLNYEEAIEAALLYTLKNLI